MKVLSVNILAQGLLLSFWRGSYGLPLLINQAAYDLVLSQRMTNLIELIKKEDPDVLCLQETTIESIKYLTEQLPYTLIGESYKSSPFGFGYPPHEKGRTMNVRTGVATLVRAGFACQLITTAENFGSVESPYVIICFEDKAMIKIINAHLKMNFPNIDLALGDLYEQVRNLGLNLRKTILIGDLNAHQEAAAQDLKVSSWSQEMVNLTEIYAENDHVLLGKDLLLYPYVAYFNQDPILEMHVNREGSNRQSSHNENLLLTGKICTDHHPLILKIEI